MRKHSRPVLALLAAIPLLLGSTLLTSPAEAQSGKRIRVAILVKTLSNPYWLMLQAGAEAAGRETGARVIVSGSQSELDVQGQINRVRSMITQHVDLIGISPNSGPQLQPVLEQAVAAGIPVILIDTDIPKWSGRTSFIGTDNYQAGVVAGQYVSKTKSGGNLAIIGGTPGNVATESRVAGLKEALKASAIHYVSELAAYSDRSRAVTATSDTLQAHHDVNVIFAPADNMALGTVEAIKAANRNPSSFTIVGVDGTPEGVQSIIDGGITATVAQNPYAMGKDTVEMAIKKLKGGSIPTRIDTGVVLVTKDNAAGFLATLNKEMKGS